MEQNIFERLFGSEPVNDDGLKKRFELVRTKRTQLLTKLADIAKTDPTVSSFMMLVDAGAVAMDDALASMISRLVEERNAYQLSLNRHVKVFGDIDPTILPFLQKQRHIIIQRLPIESSGDAASVKIQYSGEVVSVYHDAAANQIVLVTLVTNDAAKDVMASISQ